MLTFKNISATEAVVSSIKEAQAAKWPEGVYVNRCDFGSKEDAIAMAEKLNVHYRSSPKFIVTDEGEGCSPRYDVIQAPQLGDDVSYSFNGDSYPCGKIISISATMKTIKTSEGKVFYRHRETGSWKSGPWSLIQGTISEQNPHF